MSLPTAGAATAARIGKGTTLGYAAPGGSPTFVILAELVDLKPPKHKAEILKVMRYDSPTLWAEIIGGWLEAGECEFQVVYNAAQGSAMFLLLGLPQQFQLTKPDATTWTYQAILTEFGDEIPLKDKMLNTVKFAINGAPIPSSTSA